MGRPAVVDLAVPNPSPIWRPARLQLRRSCRCSHSFASLLPRTRFCSAFAAIGASSHARLPVDLSRHHGPGSCMPALTAGLLPAGRDPSDPSRPRSSMPSKAPASRRAGIFFAKTLSCRVVLAPKQESCGQNRGGRALLPSFPGFRKQHTSIVSHGAGKC